MFLTTFRETAFRNASRNNLDLEVQGFQLQHFAWPATLYVCLPCVYVQRIRVAVKKQSGLDLRI